MVVQGLIRPPPEIRVVADRTALYVAKNGRTFETRILNSAKGQTPKFAFLQPTSPFHAYYEDRIQFYENNGGIAEEERKDDKSTGKDEGKKNVDDKDNQQSNNNAAKDDNINNDITNKVKQTQKSSAIHPIAKALLTQRTKIAEFYKNNTSSISTTTDPDTTSSDDPASLHDRTTVTTSTNTILPPPPPKLNMVQIIAPASLNIMELETIQMTAQLIAISSYVSPSINLLHALTVREWNNPNFRFCQPRHGHFAYFSALVDAYKQILIDWSTSASSSTSSSSSSLLTKNRSDRMKQIESMAGNIDKCLEITAYRAEYQRDREERLRQNNNEELLANKIDWHDFVVVETIEFGVDEVVANLPPPPPQTSTIPKPTTTVTTAATSTASGAKNDSDMEDDDDDDEGETIHVVPTYTPKISGDNDTANNPVYVIDPISGKRVNVNDMPEHMRIQLLDPKWAEERKKFQEKQKESNLVSGDVVASNLERFAQARGDRFGKKEQSALSEEAESKRRLEEANRIIREQGDSQRTVGPTLPTQQQQKSPLTLPPPIATEIDATTNEPAAKRPKIVTYAASVLAQQQQQLQQVSGTTAPIVAITPTVVDDPFATAVGGGVSMSISDKQQDLIPEAEFAASLPKPEMTLQIRVPNDPTNMAWNFYGQIVSISTTVMTQVKEVKSELSSVHLNGLPANKIQLKIPSNGVFLKDNLTLAAHNISPSTTLELVPRARGGKKK